MFMDGHLLHASVFFMLLLVFTPQFQLRFVFWFCEIGDPQTSFFPLGLLLFTFFHRHFPLHSDFTSTPSSLFVFFPFQLYVIHKDSFYCGVGLLLVAGFW